MIALPDVWWQKLIVADFSSAAVRWVLTGEVCTCASDEQNYVFPNYQIN